jgi:hypothetical protein
MDLRHKYTYAAYCLAAAIVLAGIGSVVSAQSPEPVQFILAPETPGPNETVIIEAEGIGSFLGESDITWKINGAVRKSGVGERQFSFTTGALGTRGVVEVTIKSDTQGVITRSFTFNPSLVNLIWEADTTAPPLYRGKALYSAGSRLTVMAFPTVYSGAARVAASALSFQWLVNDEPVPSQSGRGKSTISFTGDQLRAGEVVQVDIYYGNTKVAKGEISIPSTDPQLILYERSALRGVNFEQAFSSIVSLVTKEISIQVQPYYFARSASDNGLLQYDWTLNGETTTGPDTAQGALTLRQEGSGSGSANIEISVQNNTADQFVQAASSVLQILFGTQSANLFGL